MNPQVKLIDNNDGTWTATIDGAPAATIMLAPMSNKALSVDVQPCKPSKVNAIAFGAKATFDRDRFTLGPANGTIKKGSLPFVCVAIYPENEATK